MSSPVRFESFSELWFDESLGGWCAQSDRRLANTALADFAICVFLIWTAEGWLLYALLSVVVLSLFALAIVSRGAALHPAELISDAQGVQIRTDRWPWTEIVGFRAEPLVVLGYLKQPIDEISALVVERDGERVAYGTRASLEHTQALAEQLNISLESA